MLRSPTIPSAVCKLRPRSAGGWFKGLRAGRWVGWIPALLEDLRAGSRRAGEKDVPALGQAERNSSLLPTLLSSIWAPAMDGAHSRGERRPLHPGCCPRWPFALRLLTPGRDTALRSAPAGMCRQLPHRAGGWGLSLLIIRIIRDYRCPLCRSEKLRGQFSVGGRLCSLKRSKDWRGKPDGIPFFQGHTCTRIRRLLIHPFILSRSLFYADYPSISWVI